MFRSLIVVAVCAVCAGTSVASAQGRGRGGAPAPAPPQLSAGDTYLWHGEFVSLDPASRTLTVKARLLRQAAPDVERLNPGDRVLLTWSGQDIHAGAVRRVTRYDPGQQIVEFFALPAELGSRDVSGDLITVKVRVPEASVGAVKGTKPTEWVSLMARQRPKSDADAIATVSAYAKPEK
ncbi:MAG: hypothetical protein HY824_11890 [Acidobacteria bacterium]|nr:hypothetical protein [Acidobacteriota bacterium]